MLIGRKEQIHRLEALLEAPKSSFVSITGRRRVGKTYLIDQVYKDQICFRVTGIQDGGFKEQLTNFGYKLAEHGGTPFPIVPTNWQEAFLQLKAFLLTKEKKHKHVLFFDELPWINTPRSGMLQQLAHLWNDYLSKETHFILVICGSSTSWIVDHVVNAKGGLHNRLTDRIQLLPFNLSETKEFLVSNNLRLTHLEITKIYMALGGVPFYLEQIRAGESATIAIERICFTEDGPLRNEYDNLYKALFTSAENHEAIIQSLAAAPQGLTREEIIKKSKVQSGGPYTRAMEDLMLSGFITELSPFYKVKRGTLYRLQDEFSIFYHRFMKRNKKYSPGIWGQLSASQSYKIWSGYAFEALCLKHIPQIKQALGISGIYLEVSSYQHPGQNGEPGIQIDMILDRKDGVINLCENKYYATPFQIDKAYANQLRLRRQLFIDYTGTKKQVFNTMITSLGLVPNAYAKEVIDADLSLDQLFN